MSGAGSDTAEWARAHGARFEVEPLIEMNRGQRVQVGFTVRLFARLPQDERPSEERWEEATRVRMKLRELLQSLAPAEGAGGRLEIEPLRTAAVLAGGGSDPEITVSAQVFHGEGYFKEATKDEEKRVYEGARRLQEMGLHEGRGRS